MTLLDVRGLSVRYGGVIACNAVNLQVQPNTICGLIGPNGAGKTTFVEAISGFVRHTGTIHLDGRDISRERVYRRVELGMTRTFQSLELFDDLTIRENLLVGNRAASRRSTQASPRSASVEETLLEISRNLKVDRFLDKLPGELSQGERRRVTVARALVPNPALIVLDEPAAGLDSWETVELRDHIRQLKLLGVAVLMIDHDMDLVLSACDDIYVLDLGSVIAHGTPSEISADEHVIAAYLGDYEQQVSENGSEAISP